MQKCTGLFVSAVILGVGMATLACATADRAAPDAQAVKAVPGPRIVNGDLLQIEGDFYIIKDTTGKDNRLHVDKTTQLEGAVKAGDKVEARVTEQGHALSVTKPLVADAQIPGPQTVKGDVLNMDGEFFIVKDTTGKDIRLHVDRTTQLEGAVKAGDKIEAQVTEQGHALSMKHAQAQPATK